MSTNDLASARHTLYVVPDNVTPSVAEGFDVEEARREVDLSFAWWNGQPASSANYRVPRLSPWDLALSRWLCHGCPSAHHLDALLIRSIPSRPLHPPQFTK